MAENDVTLESILERVQQMDFVGQQRFWSLFSEIGRIFQNAQIDSPAPWQLATALNSVAPALVERFAQDDQLTTLIGDTQQMLTTEADITTAWQDFQTIQQTLLKAMEPAA